jgi:hypothetical protein
VGVIVMELKQLSGDPQKVGNGRRSEFRNKPPLDKDSAATRAYLLLNRGSTTEDKRADAARAKEKNERAIEWLQQAYDKKAEEKGDDSPEAATLWTKLNFMKEISDFMDVQTARFIEIKNAFNVQKDNIQKQFDARINAPRYMDILKTYLPWLGGAALATGMAGAEIWNWAVGRVQDVFSKFDPQTVESMTDFAGLILLAGLAALQNYLGRRKKAKLVSKCTAKKDAIDQKERGIKESILRLISIEYDRLSTEYGFAPHNPDVANASARAEKVRHETQVKYGVELPYPIFDSTSAEAPNAAQSRFKAFLSSIKVAFKGLAGKKSGQATPVDGQ